MKITPLGKAVLLLIVLGMAVGAFKFFGSKGKIPGVNTQPTTVANSNTAVSSGGNNNGTTESGNNPGVGSTDDGASTNSQGELQIVTSASKRGWLNDQIDAFNAQSDVKLVPKLIETREAMQQIIAGRIKPALWSPSSVIWADRLSEVLEQKTGSSPLDTGDSNSYRSV